MADSGVVPKSPFVMVGVRAGDGSCTFMVKSMAESGGVLESPFVMVGVCAGDGSCTFMVKVWLILGVRQNPHYTSTIINPIIYTRREKDTNFR